MRGIEGEPPPATATGGADPTDSAAARSEDAPAEGMRAEDVRPNVAVSQCLGFAAVRYDGRVLRSRFVETLRDHVHFVQVCPEVGMGMGVPRDPIHIEERPGGLRLIQPGTGRDLTDDMREFSAGALPALDGVDGFVLKSRSPSCGIRDTKIYGPGDESEPIRRGSGLFAAAVLEAFPWAAIEDESRLADPTLRHRFLTHLWAMARLREVEAEGTVSALAAFHASYEFVLTSLGPDVPARLGRIPADPDGRAAPALVASYRSALGRVLADPPRAVPRKDSFPDRERSLEPYPRALFDVSDSGGEDLV